MADYATIDDVKNSTIMRQIKVLDERVTSAEDASNSASTKATEAITTASSAVSQVEGVTDSVDDVETDVSLLAVRVGEAESDIVEGNGRMDGIDTEITTIDTKIDKDYYYTATPSTDASTVKMTIGSKNIKTGVESTEQISYPVASDSQAGVMNASDHSALTNAIASVENLANRTIYYSVDFSGCADPYNPNQTEITAIYTALNTGYTTPVQGTILTDFDTAVTVQYYTSSSTWYKTTSTVSIGGLTTLGVVKGSSTDGEVYINVDGSMSLNGYDDVTTDIDNVESQADATDTVVNAHVVNTNVHLTSTEKANVSTIPDLALKSEVSTSEETIDDLFDMISVPFDTGACKWIQLGPYFNISGTGDMPDFTNGSTPWFSQDDSTVSKASISSGVTNIGDYTFQSFTSIKSFTIPDSVTSIGGYGFQNCTSLASITIPDNVTSIGERAFEMCEKLQSIVIGSGVTTLPELIFHSCSSLRSITLGTQPSGGITQGSNVWNSTPSNKNVYSVGGWANATTFPCGTATYHTI